MDKNRDELLNDALQEAIAVIGPEATPELLDVLRDFYSPGTQAYLQVVREVAGFEMADHLKKPFLEFHRYVTDPQPDFIIKLRTDEKREDYWYLQLVNGIIGNVQQSFLCVLYHQSRLLSIESELMNRLKSLGEVPGVSQNGVLGIGGTRILDFEYQAYVMAYRRCLDQFATALSAFFKDRTSSFRKLPKNLAHKRPSEVVNALINVHQQYASVFEFVMTEGGDPSVRDRIAHFEFVPAGTLNIRADGNILVGGGENLNVGKNADGRKTELAKAITAKTISLHCCISEIIDAFIKSVTAWEHDAKAA